MAIRQGNRGQLQMLPACIEDYVPQDAPVRVYDAFVDNLDFGELGIECNPGKEGNPCYDPRAMLKLLTYGYSYGIRSSRRLEREVNYNLSFIWLMGGLKPDFKTIAEFRRKNKEALQRVLRECVRLCIRLDLITGNILFVDGCKIRANASIQNSWSKEQCEKALSRIDKKIKQIIAEAEEIDEAEEGQPSLVQVNKELQNARALKEQVIGIMKALRQEERASLNTVDRECTVIHSRQGTHAGHNAQVVVDDKNGLIVSSDVAPTNNDLGQFSVQIAKANAEMGKKCQVGVADSGYARVSDIAKIIPDQIQVLVPTQPMASKKGIGEFDKRSFAYDPSKDCYTCPKGHILVRCGRTRRNNGYRYKFTDKNPCPACQQYGRCTKAKCGRTIERRDDEALRDCLEKEYALSENQAIYKRRQEKIELVFGHIKRNLGVVSFLLRGLKGVRAEMSLLSLCFNLRRMITMLGVAGLMQKMREGAGNIARFFSSSNGQPTTGTLLTIPLPTPLCLD